MKSNREKTKVQVGEIDLGKPVDLIVLGSRKQEKARCRARNPWQEN